MTADNLDGTIVYVHQMPGGQMPDRVWPKDGNGLTQTALNMDISGFFDFKDAFAQAYFAGAKLQPGGSVGLVMGLYRTTGPVYIPPVSSWLKGVSKQASRIFYDGVAGTDFLIGGNVNVPETSIPISGVSSAGGNTTLTCSATAGAKWRRAGTTNAFVSIPNCDPWGQWMSLFAAMGVRDAGSNYGRGDVIAFNESARTVTIQGTFGFTPTQLCFPALTVPAQAYAVNDSHPDTIFTRINDVRFYCKNKGVVQLASNIANQHPDEKSRYERFTITQAYSSEINPDSDGHFDDVTIEQSFAEGPTMKCTDSKFHDFVVSGTQSVGMVWDSALDHVEFDGYTKLFYGCQGADVISKARAITVNKVNSAYAESRFVVEDFAGCGFYIFGLSSNIHLTALEISHMGAIGLGSPGSIGSKPWWVGDVVRIAKNISLEDIELRGVVRSSFGSRDGQYGQSQLYIEGPNTAVYATTGLNHVFRNVVTDFDWVQSDISGGPPWNLTPDLRKPVWNSSKADYASGDVVQLVNTAQAVRYQAKVNNPTAGSSPATNTAQWKYVGGGANMWIDGMLWQADTGAFAPEFWNCQLIINGERHPAFHQRNVGKRTAYTVDPEQDVVVIDQTGFSGTTTLDVFRGDDQRMQLFRAGANVSVANAAIFQPGSRSRSTPGIAGSIGKLTRVGAEMRIKHEGFKIWWLPHNQTELISSGSQQLDLSDYGKTLLHTGSGLVTYTAPSVATLPDGWFCYCGVTGGGAIDFVGVASLSGKLRLTQDKGTVYLKKMGGAVALDGPGLT